MIKDVSTAETVCQMTTNIDMVCIMTRLSVLHEVVNFSHALKMFWCMVVLEKYPRVREREVYTCSWEESLRPFCWDRSIRELNGNCPFVVFADEGPNLLSLVGVEKIFLQQWANLRQKRKGSCSKDHLQLCLCCLRRH